MIHVATEIEKAQQDIHTFRVQEWKDRWRGRYRREHGLPLDAKTPEPPEPTDRDINWPEPMVSVQSGKCIITMTLAGYEKLPAKKKKLFHKLGGL